MGKDTLGECRNVNELLRLVKKEGGQLRHAKHGWVAKKEGTAFVPRSIDNPQSLKLAVKALAAVGFFGAFFVCVGYALSRGGT